MAKIILILIMSGCFGFAQDVVEPKIIDVDNWGKYFTEANLQGTFILNKFRSDTLRIYNTRRANEHYLPASTFKILNSLISLETGVIKNEKEIIEWDGTKRFSDNWNKNQNLKTAMKYSCVWFYQELARRVGSAKMQYYLDTVNYGNSKMGAAIDNFWLEGELKISAVEQIVFLYQFLSRKLPFSNRNFDIVKKILQIDSTNIYQLYAKTGWTARTNEQIGWYVGFVENKLGIWIFAMNIDINEMKDSENREGITRKILGAEGLIY